MPNWKKVIVSGSDAALNSVTTPNGVLNTFSASYALTASYALNGGTGGSGISAIYIADEGNVQGTASYFDFNGAGVSATISNGTASITIPGGGGSGDTNSSNAILSQTVAATTWSFDHNLGTLYPVFTIYDANDDVIIPQKIHTVTTSSALIYFSSARTGTAVASKGGNVVTASLATSASYALRATSASYAATATSASYATNSTSASYSAITTSASYAITSSYSNNSTSASYAANSTSASYATLATSASYAVSSSYSLSGSYAVTASYAATASYSKNIVISGSVNNADYIDFNTSATFADAVGRLGYDSGEGTLVFGLAGGNINLKIGTDLYQYVYNNTNATLTKGQVVYASGSQGNRIAVKLASATAELGSANTLGFVAETIAQGAEGWVMTEGNLRGLDTSTLEGGKLIFLGTTPGTYTQSYPIAPNHGVRLGYAERIDSTVGSIYVKIDNGYELDELHDVKINGKTHGDLLMQSASIWINSKQLSGSYGLTGSLQATSFTGSLLGTASYASFANTSSYAQTASYADNFTVQGTLTAQTLVVQTITSSVEQVTGSTQFGSIILNTHEFTGSVSISGSLQVNGSDVIKSNQTSSMSVATASYVLNAVSASYATSALTASYAATAPYSGLQGTVPTWNQNTTGTAATASYVLQAVSASFATNALTASYASNVPETASYALVALTASYASNVPVTASYALNANTSSYALTASYISGSGAGVGFPFSGSAVITGSLFVSSSFISGSFTGSLEGTASYATFALSASNAPGFTTNKTQSSPAVTWSFVHNLNTRNPLIQVYDTNYNQVIPNAIVATDALTATIYFDYSASGYAVASNGGGLYITGSTSRLDQTSAAVTWSFTHNLNTKYPAFEVYDENDFVVIPSGIRVINENSAELYFGAPSTGKAIANFSGINGAPNATTASYSVTSEWNGLNAKPISSSLGTAAAASTTVVAQVATASYSAAFFDYAVISGSNSRAGTVMSVWNGGSVEYTDTSTSDIGNTDQVTMSVDLSGANVRLKSTTTDAWTVKSLIRLI